MNFEFLFIFFCFCFCFFSVCAVGYPKRGKTAKVYRYIQIFFRCTACPRHLGVKDQPIITTHKPPTLSQCTGPYGGEETPIWKRVPVFFPKNEMGSRALGSPITENYPEVTPNQINQVTSYLQENDRNVITASHDSNIGKK